MNLEFSRQIFEKYADFLFYENTSCGSRVVPCGWTDRHDEASSLFSQLYERSYKWLACYLAVSITSQILISVDYVSIAIWKCSLLCGLDACHFPSEAHFILNLPVSFVPHQGCQTRRALAKGIILKIATGNTLIYATDRLRIAFRIETHL